MLSKKKKHKRAVVLTAVVFLILGLMIGLTVMEYKLERFGDMVCRDKYGMHYEFRGFHDHGNSMSYSCTGLWSDEMNGRINNGSAVAFHLSSALDLTKRINSDILSDESGGLFS